MSLVPIERGTERRKPLNEHERGKLRKEKEKAEHHNRNPHRKR